jgi:tetratricopeptide (TPR) repeat protein
MQVLNQFIKTFMGISLAASIAYGQGAAAPQKTAKDQVEYGLMTDLGKEADPAKKIPILDTWTQKYPDTAFKQERNYYYMDTYSKIASKGMPSNAAADVMDAAQKAAQTLIEKADTFFSAENKLPNVTDAQWAQAKQQILLQAQGTLATIAFNKKDYPAAEEQYKKWMALDPGNALIDNYLGSAIMAEKKIDRYPEAIFYFARAVSLTGPGAIKDEAVKKQISDYLNRIYNNYHGSPDGLDDIKAKAVASMAPPADFKIKSITEISMEANSNAEQFAKTFPEIMIWRGLKEQLTAAGGDDYFKNMKDAEISGLKGKVVSQNGDKELTLSMDYATPETEKKAEMTIKFETPLKGEVPVGTVLTLAAVPESFTKDPFMVIATAEKAKVDGLGDAAGAPETKKAAPKKKAPTKAPAKKAGAL